MKSKMTLKTKLIVSMLAVGIVPLLIAGILMLTKSSNALQQQAFNQLESLRTVKTTQVEDYFNSMKLRKLKKLVSEERMERYEQIHERTAEAYVEQIVAIRHGSYA